MNDVPHAEERRLQRMQQRAFDYFLYETNPENGLVVDKTAEGWPASIAATGLAMSCYPVAVERGFVTRGAARARVLATLRFFRDSEQGRSPDASGYRGFYYHFLDMKSGRRAWRCELSSVDTAFLVVGMLCAAQYFDSDEADERELRELARLLYERVDWKWALGRVKDGNARAIAHGWRPESGFLRYRWEGYDEAMLLYLLALGSPTHPVPAETWRAWCASYEWIRYYDVDYLYAGPLFTHQLSHVWVDFRGIRDAFLREKGIDYFENSRRATIVQQRYARENPQRFHGYGEHAWGITASDGPGPTAKRVDGIQRRFYDYIGRGVPFGPDDGTLAPWAVVASMPFAPEIVLPTIHHWIEHLKLHDSYRYGFRATYNATFARAGESPGWISPFHFGLNLGPNVLMIENHRSGLVWALMRGCVPLVEGLRRAGFEGGWLDAASGRNASGGAAATAPASAANAPATASPATPTAPDASPTTTDAPAAANQRRSTCNSE